MQPSIGRIVHYAAPGNDEFPPRTLPALITLVHEDSSVDLVVFGGAGFGFKYNVPEGELPQTWAWPPRV